MEYPVQFIRDFKQAGFIVTNERDFVLRLKEATNWKYALYSLLRNGSRIGIEVQRTAPKRLSVKALAARLGLSPSIENALASVPR